MALSGPAYDGEGLLRRYKFVCGTKYTATGPQMSECASPPTRFTDSFRGDKTIFTPKLLQIPPRTAVLLYQDCLVTVAAERPELFWLSCTADSVLSRPHRHDQRLQIPAVLKLIFTTNITPEEGELKSLIAHRKIDFDKLSTSTVLSPPRGQLSQGGSTWDIAAAERSNLPTLQMLPFEMACHMIIEDSHSTECL